MNGIQHVSKTDLARKTRQVIRTVQRGETAVIESHGEEEAVIIDILDYRILRAVMRYHARPKRSELRDEDLRRIADAQARYNLVLAHYLSGAISVARVAELLDLSPFELRNRFQRLDVPLRMAPGDVAEAKDDFEAAKAAALKPPK
jgi:prevent-host-death family protein